MLEIFRRLLMGRKSSPEDMVQFCGSSKTLWLGIPLSIGLIAWLKDLRGLLAVGFFSSFSLTRNEPIAWMYLFFIQKEEVCFFDGPPLANRILEGSPQILSYQGIHCRGFCYWLGSCSQSDQYEPEMFIICRSSVIRSCCVKICWEEVPAVRVGNLGGVTLCSCG